VFNSAVIFAIINVLKRCSYTICIYAYDLADKDFQMPYSGLL